MKRTLACLLLALAGPAWALQVALLIRIEFDRGVMFCVYRAPDGSIHRQIEDIGKTCPGTIYVP